MAVLDRVPQPQSADRISTREKGLHESAAPHMEMTENRPTLAGLSAENKVDVQKTDSDEYDKRGLVV